MRTKALLLTAAFAAVGVVTSSAQVYSVNAVGYVNLQIPKGFSMIANPLKAASNTVGGLLTAAPDVTTIFKFTNGKFSINTKDFGDFATPAETLNPGEGAFISAPAAFTVTFVGEVPQGALTQPVPKGFSIQASQVPQSGQLDTVLKFPAADGDAVYRFSNSTGKYATSTYDFGAWDVPPVPAVGESFFVNKVAAVDWKRDFSVNN